MFAAEEKKDLEQKETNVDEQASLPIVDTHEHLWDLSKFNLPWTKGDEVLGRSFVTSDYLETQLQLVETLGEQLYLAQLVEQPSA